MDLKRLANSLHSFERRVLPSLENYSKLGEIVKFSGMQEIEVVRALKWLENKNIASIKVSERELVISTGKTAELPERIVLDNLGSSFITLDELRKRTKLSDQELNACIGFLKRKSVITIKKDKGLNIKLTENGSNLAKNKTPEEEFFYNLKNRNLFIDELSNEEKYLFSELRKRGLVTTERTREKSAVLTELGRKLLKEKIETNIIEALTPEILRNKEWKRKKIRGYDINARVPQRQRGRRHFVDQSIEYVKRIWLDMGFKELEGNIVQTAFWNLDALFVPQDHSAREMQDTFFVGNKGNILKGKIGNKTADNIKKVHENGWTTGSKGWGGVWKTETAKDVLLRTHTTVLSAIALAKLKKENLPAKFFKVGVVYRNETADWKHLFEFYQIEGIVVDPNANFRHLIGYLKEFYKKMGFDKIRIKPSFFPYTSPSLEVSVWNQTRKAWIEVGGAGIFRPEVTKPLLGFECPVLAWGQGLERILVEYYKIKDLRDIYKNDLKMLREVREFMK